MADEQHPPARHNGTLAAGLAVTLLTLARGDVPGFLAPVPLPEPLGRSFKVFSLRP